MWYLESIKEPNVQHYILPGITYTIGRKEGPNSFQIINDASISRKHAELFIRYEASNLASPGKPSSLHVKDSGSKFGTSVRSSSNEFKLGKDEVKLNDGDKVTFGQMGSSFFIHYKPLIITTSCLSQEEKHKVKSALTSLGGHLVAEWRGDCTHLVMSGIQLTVKAACALLSLKPIVTVDYLEKLLENCRAYRQLPNASECLPPIQEPTVDTEKANFTTIPERKTLFKGKRFFFLSNAQYTKMHFAISLGGGDSTLITEHSTINSHLLIQENSCVCQYQKQKNETEVPKYVNEIMKILKRHNLRLIHDSDIGLAVAYCSTERHCNPSFDVGKILFGKDKLASQTLDGDEVYVSETQQTFSEILNQSTLPTNDTTIESDNEDVSECSTMYTTNQTIAETVLKNTAQSNASSLSLRRRKFVEATQPMDESEILTQPADESEIPTQPAENYASEIVPAKRRKLSEEILFEDPILEEPSTSKARKRRSPSPEIFNVPEIKRPKKEKFDSIVEKNECSSISKGLQKMAVENPPSRISLTSPVKIEKDLTGFVSKFSKIKKEKVTLKEEKNPLIDIDENDDKKPLMKIECVSLLKPKTENGAMIGNKSTLESGKKNVKTFKKVWQRPPGYIPNIIGGSDLEPYKAANTVDDYFDNKTKKVKKEKNIFDSQADVSSRYAKKR